MILNTSKNGCLYVLFDDLNNQQKCLVAVAIRSYLLI